MPINPLLKLNPKILDSDVEQKPTRDGYGEGLVLAGEMNKNVVALTADLSESTRVDAFAEKFPERFIELGVAEQNMATIAAGLGISGKIPFISSYATFSPGRNWEQIRTTVAYNDSNVKIAGHHTGLSVGPDGATHQALEDIALMRVMPNMKIFVPCDAVQAGKATLAASRIWGPVYLRFTREKTPIFTTQATPFIPGKLEIFWDSPRPAVAIIACGPIIGEALKAAVELKKRKTEVVVANCHTISPMDREGIAALAGRAGAVVTVEEHQVRGGLGGAVAEVVAGTIPVPMEFVGMQNTF
ncbi:MAG TPA: transketolase C-terminal domain-containing protein, partial [Candidatus Paceibacterota bacterium]